MELKFVIPNMEKTFGNLEFAGEDKTEQRRINGRMTVLSRSFNLYSDVQRADDIVVKTGNHFLFFLKRIYRPFKVRRGSITSIVSDCEAIKSARPPVAITLISL